MNIALIGYGRMGRTIERLAAEKGYNISGKIDMDTSISERRELLSSADVAIEFSHPSAAYSNIVEALELNNPVVSGTTGWLDKSDELQSLIQEKQGGFFYASNFSIGVNIFFAINKKLASLMDDHPSYDVRLEEVHHIHKKDEPSGTAITIAEGILEGLDRKDSWTLEEQADNTIKIAAYRRGEVYGDHKVIYSSDMDTIEFAHSAHTRDGFALGAITAARWLYNQGSPHKGWLGMTDLMGI